MQKTYSKNADAISKLEQFRVTQQSAARNAPARANISAIKSPASMSISSRGAALRLGGQV